MNFIVMHNATAGGQPPTGLSDPSCTCGGRMCECLAEAAMRIRRKVEKFCTSPLQSELFNVIEGKLERDDIAEDAGGQGRTQGGNSKEFFLGLKT